jgi:hypothetical protein
MQELYASKIPEIKTLGQSDKVELIPIASVLSLTVNSGE